ncbi:Rne/Rng family ribonuclease [Rhodobacteraceae bacterium NNCM2]|nr:Rne/Rng family ribonuclease [Coraliihabitans acroporae]
MGKKMLIDATHPEETRVVVVDGNKVDDFDFESLNRRQLAGNIYLAKVTRVEPSLQAAFVDYGGNRHGFLAFSEIHPDYYQIPIADREALLAEEERAEREAESADTPAEAAEEKPAEKKRSRRSRSNRKPKSSDTVKASETVAGLEVIDAVTDDQIGATSEQSGSLAVVDLAAESTEVAESAEVEETPAQATAAEEPVAETDVEAPATEPAAVAEAEPTAAETPTEEPIVQTAAEPAEAETASENAEEAVAMTETEAEEEPAPEGEGKPEKPITMAEDSGLEDESVSEAIPDVAAEPTTAKRKDESAAEPTVAPETPAEATSEAVSETLVTEKAAPKESAEAAAPEQQEESQAPESVEASETAVKAEEEKKEDAPRKRSRRSRRSKSSNAEAKAQPSEEAPAERNGDETNTVESVGAEDLQEEVASARARRRRTYKIQDVIKVRQIMLVQVVKEERGNKGAALTTYLSLAGRYCVLMPNTARGGGISRKITQVGDRKRLREIIDELEVPKGMGLIVRTAGAERTRPEIKRDYEFLSRQWEQVRDLTLKSIAPTLIYEEGSLIKRSIRDLYSKDIDSIMVEGETGYREAKDYMKMLMPSHAKNVQQYSEQVPLFIRYQVESYLNGMFSPTVQLKSGGYIVIGVTEALVAIDVNSGRATKQGSIEETALQTNLEAADEVARQCRLRDLAGLIVIDFIDMEENRNNRAVEKRMKDRLKNDRARIQIGRISSFGLMEMSRQRLRPGMLEATTSPCPHCQGTGVIRSDENMALSILREVEEEGVRGRAAEIIVTTPVDVANFLLNHKRDHIASIEARCGTSIIISGDPLLVSPDFKIDRSKQASRTIVRSSAAVTAESVVTEDDVEDATIIEAEAEEEKTETAEERPEREGKSRRRRGKRGGRRRRNQDDNNEQSAEKSAEEEPSKSEEPVEAAEEKPAEAASLAEAEAAPQPETAEAEAETPQPEVVEEVAAIADETPADEAPTAETVEPAPEPVSVPIEVTPEPEPRPEPTPEPVAAEAAPEPKPSRPKRKGWWSLGG